MNMNTSSREYADPILPVSGTKEQLQEIIRMVEFER